VTPTNHRLKYLAWLLPAVTLGLTLPASGREEGLQGRAAATPAAQSAPTPPQGPGRGGPPRPGSGQGEWWKDELVVKELQLSPAKARAIDRIFTDREKRVSAIVQQVPVELDKLEKMAEERIVDEATFALQVAQWQALRARAIESRWIMLYRMSLELTPEQHKKLREIQERNRGRSGRGSH
jgi:Spy/CpxP family protein refolding chaperone